jgi:ketosteroid isomerase-like protein
VAPDLRKQNCGLRQRADAKYCGEMTQGRIETVKQLAAAWNRDDFEAFVELLDPGVEWRTSIEPFFEGTESVFRGHEGMREFWDSYRGETFRRLEVRMDEFRDLGDSVLSLGEIKTLGQASEVELRSELAQLWTFRGGKIASSDDFLSHAEGLRAAGLDD